MSVPNSAPNSEAKTRFFALFAQHWDACTGLDSKTAQQDGCWTVRSFSNAVEKAGFSAPDPDTIGAWLKGERWPQPARKGAILAVFFPAKQGNDAARQKMLDAWTDGQREVTPRRKARIEDSAASLKWVISRHGATEGLADLRLHQPFPLNEEGSYRVEASARLDIAEFAHERQDYGIGVTTVLLAVESEGYQVTRGSMIGERPADLPARLRADGVELHGPRDNDSGCIVGDLLGEEHVANIESLNDGEAPVYVSLRAARRAFKVLGLNAQGRNTPVAVSEETDAVINALLGKDRERDSLGRVVLAKASMKRKPE